VPLPRCGFLEHEHRLAAMAKGAGHGYQMGCHPGESGILSAAGRHFATTVADIRFREGSYDRHLLKELLTHEDITFGYGGRAPALSGPGLGVTVRRDVLARWTVRSEACCLG
ncbi:MAG: enolase C-terminal domain-like protein, partial [Pirellulales bacterium]